MQAQKQRVFFDTSTVSALFTSHTSHTHNTLPSPTEHSHSASHSANHSFTANIHK